VKRTAATISFVMAFVLFSIAITGLPNRMAPRLTDNEQIVAAVTGAAFLIAGFALWGGRKEA
jgi:hypothetical protein